MSKLLHAFADRVVIRTKRTQQPGDSDNEGWNFETEGVGSFGELRRDGSISPGTEVRLHLRHEVTGKNPLIWYETLVKYIRRELSRIPCEFSIKANIAGAVSLQLKPGFTYDASRLAESISQELGQNHRLSAEPPIELLTRKRREELEAQKQYWAATRNELREKLRWHVKEGELPERLGVFRIHLPYFGICPRTSSCIPSLTATEGPSAPGKPGSAKRILAIYRKGTRFLVGKECGSTSGTGQDRASTDEGAQLRL